jgi:hypothetical protein
MNIFISMLKILNGANNLSENAFTTLCPDLASLNTTLLDTPVLETRNIAVKLQNHTQSKVS